MEILGRASAMKGVASKVGRQLVKEHLTLVYRCLSSGHNAIVSPTLDLLTAIGSVDGSLNELLFSTLDLSLKSLPKFALMRKKILAQGERHDIRTAYVNFILCFVQHGNYGTKAGLGKMQNLVAPVFVGLPDDKFELVIYILDTIRAHVLMNEKKNKSLAIAFLFSSSLAKVAKLYESADDRISEAADNFLRLVGTNPDIGLVFKHPSETVGGQLVLKNKIMLDLILTINPIESLKKQELCLDILAACPDILPQFWTRSSFSFEPEASARYINLCVFAVRLLQSVPLIVTLTPEAQMILPKGLTPSSLNRGLTHSNKLVSLYSALLLSACFERLERYIAELEWHLSLETRPDHRARLTAGRDTLLTECFSQVPTGKTLYQAYTQYLKQEVTAATSLIIEKLLIVMRIASRLALNHPDFGRNLIPVVAGKVPALHESGMKAYWEYVIGTCSFAYDDASIDHVLANTPSYSKLALCALSSSGFANPAELAFVKSLDVSKDFCRQILITISELKAGKFLSAGEDACPILRKLNLGPQFDSASVEHSHVSIDPAMIHRHAAKTIKIEDEERVQRTEAPELCGNAFSAVVDEIMAHVKSEAVHKAISKSSFDEYVPIAGDISRGDTARLLLVDFQPSAWLQFLARIFGADSVQQPKDLRLFLETGSLSFAIFALCSANEDVCKAGHFVLHSFYDLLVKAKFRERREIKLLIECLRHSLQDDADTDDTNITKLSPVIAAFISEAIQVLLRPAHFMYSLLMEHLLANFKLDLRKIPLIVECLSSSSESMARDQAWMIRILNSGFRPTQKCMQVYQFNHVVPAMQTLLQLPFLDADVERLARALLARIFGERAFCEELVSQNGLKAWIECLPPHRSYAIEELTLALEH